MKKRGMEGGREIESEKNTERDSTHKCRDTED